MVVAAESTLVSQAQAGDRAAFATLYDTYLPKIFDFVLGMLRNRADAEDVTSETFLKAVERLPSLKEPDAFRGWLYQIARNTALTLVESRKRAVPTAEHDEYAAAHDVATLPDPQMRAESEEMRELVWDAAATLNPRDFQVFELTVRHGMSSSDVAEVLGVRPAYAYILVNRLKGSVEEALETILLTRTGRAVCGDLDALVLNYGEDATPRLRKAVARHAKSCAACGETKKTRASVPALLAGMAFASPSAAFAAELSSKIDQAWNSTGPGTNPGGGSGGTGGSRLAHLVAAGSAVVVLTTGMVSFAARPVDEAELDGPRPTAQVEAEDTTPTADPTDAPAPRSTFRPVLTAQPQNTPFVVIIDEGDNVEPTPEPTDDGPPLTFPPQRTPKPTDPPIKPG